MWKPVILFLSLLSIGAIGYHVTEAVSVLDSLYRTVTGIFTFGFREVMPSSRQGQVFTIFIIRGGVGEEAR